MILDNEMQQKLILAAINTANWPGQIIEEVVRLRIAVATAVISTQSERIETEPEN